MGIGLKLGLCWVIFSPCSDSCHLQARFPKDANRGTLSFKEPSEGIGDCLNACCLVNLYRLTTTTRLLSGGLYSWTFQFVPPENIVMHLTICLRVS